MHSGPTRRLRHLMLDERRTELGCSLVEAERRLQRLAAERTDLVPLTHADTDRFPPPHRALVDFAAAVENGATVFTPCRGAADVLRSLAPRISRFLGIPVDPERQLAITAGTQSALFCAMAALVETGETVLLADPDYVTNERTIRFLGGGVRHVGLVPRDGRLCLDLEEVERGLRAGARLLVFSHPSNPTGAVYDRAVIKELAALINRYEARAIVDELYARLVYGSPLAHLIAEPGMLDRCVTMLGPSKTESMSGYRVGCVVAPPRVMSDLTDVLDISALRASSYAQRALLGWLEGDADFISTRVSELRALRDMTVERLAAYELMDVLPPQGTAYAFPRLSGIALNDFEVAEALIREAGVLVYPGICFGRSGAGSLRICFAQDEHRLPGLLERVGGVLESLRAG